MKADKAVAFLKQRVCVCVQEIQSLLINWKGPDLTTSGELVLEGTFHVLRAKNTRTLFLFEKMLLITKKRGEHYVYKSHISVGLFLTHAHVPAPKRRRNHGNRCSAPP